MNYRHSFHAGNFADILKHAAILMTLSALQARQPRLTVIDTHAGFLSNRANVKDSFVSDQAVVAGVEHRVVLGEPGRNVVSSKHG
jgi:hypothetical protein